MRPEPIALPRGAPKPAGRRLFAKAVGRDFKSRVVDGRTIIDVMDEIGAFGISARDFQAKLDIATGPLTVRLNSPGGEIFEGVAMYGALLKYSDHTRVEVTGLAASAASVLAMAADEIHISEGSWIMIHRAWGMTVGNAGDHSEAVALLQGIDGSMAATYAKRTGQPVADVLEAMTAETWYDADSAVENGYADAVAELPAARARFDLSIYAKAPAELSAAIDRGEPSIRDVESALREAGYSRSQAKALAARGHRGDADEQRDAAAISELAAHINAAAQSIK